MKLEYKELPKFLEVGDDSFINLSPKSPTVYDILVNQLGYKSCYMHSYIKAYITQDDLKEFYEPVDNIKSIRYVTKGVKDITFKSETYLHKRRGKDYFINTSPMEEGELEEGVRISNIFYQPDFTDSEVIDDLNKHLKKASDSSQISIVLKTSMGFDFKSHKISPLPVDIDTMYNDDFAPVHKHIVSSLKNKTKGVIMLHGEPGSGKSNYIKHLTTLVNHKKFVFIPVSIIPFLTDPSFIGELIDNKGSVLVLEDCESFIKDRDHNGDGGVVPVILNLSDGLLSDVLETQIICTFNTNISSIDAALLRKGRLISEYKFDKLTPEKTAKLVESLGMSGEKGVERSMTISEVFNLKEEYYRASNKSSGSIGFK